MKHTYLFTVYGESHCIPSMGEMIDRVNETMHQFGFDATLCVHIPLTVISAEFDNEPDEAELQRMRQELELHFAASPDIKLRGYEVSVGQPQKHSH